MNPKTMKRKAGQKLNIVDRIFRMTPKMTLKKQRMTPRMVNMTPKMTPKNKE